MENQTHGKTAKDNDNQATTQTNQYETQTNNTELLRLMSGTASSSPNKQCVNSY